MHPSIDLDFIQIPVYSALVALGAIAGLITGYFFLRAFSRRVYSISVFLDGAIVTFAAGWIGARAYHVAAHWDYYSVRPDEITSFDAGGLAMRGAFIAGFVALALYTRARRLSFGRFADAAALGLTIGQAIGWVGALVWGSNYGAVSESAIAMELPNIYGLVDPRYPLQPAEIAFFAILSIVLLVRASKRPEKGQIFLTYLLVASAANFVLGFFRGDESAFVGSLRLDQIFDAAFAVIALIAFAYRITWVNTRLKVVDAK